jgi:hypothetical protein|tara:strand:- start:654 stop:857 length:204 start_codon:yes stop_codon:yes gene_type:complete
MESTLKLNTTETVVLLSALNIITLKGSDAKIVANLQYKLEAVQQQNLKKEEAEEQKKEDSFVEMVKA